MKKPLTGRFAVRKSYEVELPALLQDHPKNPKITVKKMGKKTLKLVTAGLEFGQELMQK